MKRDKSSDRLVSELFINALTYIAPYLVNMFYTVSVNELHLEDWCYSNSVPKYKERRQAQCV